MYHKFGRKRHSKRPEESHGRTYGREEEKEGRIRRDRKSKGEEGEEVWGKMGGTFVPRPDPASFCAVPLPQLLSCLLLGCALFHQVSDADMDHRTEILVTNPNREGLRALLPHTAHGSAIVGAHRFLTALVLLVRFNETKNGFRQKQQRIKMC